MVALQPPIKPMLAKATKSQRMPAADKATGGWLFEPKWDGFRVLLFRDGDALTIQSRNGEDLTYCFPEIAAALDQLPSACVLDGELVIAHDGRLWFEELSQRIRPRSEAGGWKIAELAAAHPANYVAFDLLALDDQDLTSHPLQGRRSALESLALQPPFFTTPATTDPELAQTWFSEFEGAGLDGVIAKDLASTYQPGKRAMLKVKHIRTVDVVIAGWRAHKQPGPNNEPVVGSLLLGLYAPDGLHHVGVAASFSAARRVELTELMQRYAVEESGPHPWLSWAQPDPERRQPGGESRWSAGKNLSFHLVRPELVAEVKYDHMEGSRFRHVTSLVRFRPDRTPQSCTFDQLETPVPYDLARVAPGLSD